MYVRWQRKKRVDRRGQGPLLCAVLVESRRVEGEPRQRTVAYLGGIREGCVESKLAHHVHFWQNVTQRLDQLGDDLGPGKRERVEEVIAKRVRRVTDAERAELDKMLANLGLKKSVAPN